MPATISLDTVMSEFNDMVREELQNHERLMGTCREYDTEGETFNVPYFGSLDMEGSGFDSGNVPVKDVSQRNAVITQVDHKLKTQIANSYKTLFNYDVVMGHVKQHANAIGRFNDSLKLKILIENDSVFETGNNNIITYDEGDFRVKNLNTARWTAIDNGADDMQMSLYASAKNMFSFFNDSDFKSWDQNADRPLMKGRVGFYAGVDIRTLSSSSKANTLPGGDNPILYLVDYESMAIGYNRRPKTTVLAEEWEDRITVLSVATAGGQIMKKEAAIKITPIKPTP